MSSKKQKRHWIEYYLSFHLGVCHGPVNEITALYFKDKKAWQGNPQSNQSIALYDPMLFGGDEREGGIAGTVELMFGGDDQLAPAALAERLGKTPETMPGFRGIASVFCHGGAPGTGMMVSANYPSVPHVWVRVKRYSQSLDAPDAFMMNSSGYADSNAAHIIHEILTNEDWGMGGSPDALDTRSFVKAAATLAEERFGLSFQWTRQNTIEAFVQEVLDHIYGMFFFNPKTGLGTLKLLRNDYDPASLRHIGPNNAVLTSFRRKLWGETINEIVVEWTNPETEESETLTYQDLANIAMQGEVVSQSHNYYGIRSPELAAMVGARDIVIGSTPLASASIIVNRREWDLLPGDVVRFSWPKYDIENIIMRVFEVDYGTPDKSEIKVDLMEDIFGLPFASFVRPPTSEWQPPGIDPDSDHPDLLELPTVFMALPLPMIVQQTSDGRPSDEDFPQILIAAFATPDDPQSDIMSFVLNEIEVLPTGDPRWSGAGDKGLTGMAPLRDGLQQEVESVLRFNPESFRGRTYPAVGSIGVIGSKSGKAGSATAIHPFADKSNNFEPRFEHGHEIVLFLADLGDGEWRVARGIWDTIPREWAAGNVVWFLDDNFDSIDFSPEIANTNVWYKVQPRTSIGLRAIDLCDRINTYRPERPYLPFRPADVDAEGVKFGALDYTEDYNPRKWHLGLSWSNRNRHFEDAIYRRWSDGDVAPEDGQTTAVSIVIDDPVSGRRGDYRLWSAGTDQTFPVEHTARLESFHLWFIAVKDEVDSLQSLKIDLTLYRKGYGSDWGYFWGGWPQEWGVGDMYQTMEVDGD